MTRIRAGLICALFAALAAPAAAQETVPEAVPEAVQEAVPEVAPDPEAPPEPPKPPAQAKADAIIADGGAGEFFTNVTTSETVAAVRHNATGLTCSFPLEGGGRVHVITDIFPWGDDVACTIPMGEVSVNLYATKRPGMALASELGMASEVIKRRWPKARKHLPASAANPQVQAPIGAAHATSWFTVKDKGRDSIARVSVAVVGGWVIRLRVTGPALDVGGRTELLSDTLWQGALRDTAASAAAPPPA